MMSPAERNAIATRLCRETAPASSRAGVFSVRNGRMLLGLEIDVQLVSEPRERFQRMRAQLAALADEVSGGAPLRIGELQRDFMVCAEAVRDVCAAAMYEKLSAAFRAAIGPFFQSLTMLPHGETESSACGSTDAAAALRAFFHPKPADDLGAMCERADALAELMRRCLEGRLRWEFEGAEAK